MQAETVVVPGAPGVVYQLQVHRYGTPGARPLAYVQGGLHADEAPGMLCAHMLGQRLRALEAEGAVRGSVVLVPAANPIGLAQRVLGSAVGRFDLGDGRNFNRHYPLLDVSDAVAAGLGGDPIANAALVRRALQDALAAALPTVATPAQHLRHTLMRLSLDADLVLDLHCDGEAAMHLYTLTPLAERFTPLVRLLGARAFLLAEISGDDPFDEAVSRPWHLLAQRFPTVPLACASATVELRGRADTDPDVARGDAEAILGFLRHEGVLAGPEPVLPPALCQPTELAASHPLPSPQAGIVAFHRAPGDTVAEGDVIADVVDPATGRVEQVRAPASGLFFARTAARVAAAGQFLGKIAGMQAVRHGNLLTP